MPGDRRATEEAERYIDELIESCSDALTEPFDPVLVHHDFPLANTNYERLEARYRATEVFEALLTLVWVG